MAHYDCNYCGNGMSCGCTANEFDKRNWNARRYSYTKAENDFMATIEQKKNEYVASRVREDFIKRLYRFKFKENINFKSETMNKGELRIYSLIDGAEVCIEYIKDNMI